MERSSVPSSEPVPGWCAAIVSAALHGVALVLFLSAVGGAQGVQDGPAARAMSVTIAGPGTAPTPTSGRPTIPEAAPAPPPPPMQATTMEAVESMTVPAEPAPAPPPNEALAARPDALPSERPDPKARAAEASDPRPKDRDRAVEESQKEADRPNASPETAAPESRTADAQGGEPTRARNGGERSSQLAALPLDSLDDGIAPPLITDPNFRSPPRPPEYPRPAVRRAIEGVVVVRVLVGPDGEPTETRVWRSSGHAMLDDAARAAVARWDFEPAKRAGRAITAWVQVPVAFRLQ